MEEEVLTLEEGKQYKLRNGLLTSPLSISNNGTNYTFEAYVDEYPGRPVSVLAWKPNGKYLTDIVDSEKDIVAEAST
jgi:hypothetical protein